MPSPRPTAPSGTATPLAELLKWTPTDRDKTDFANFKCGDPFPDVSDQPLIACDQTQSYKYLLGPALITGESVTQRVGRGAAGLGLAGS